MAELSTGSHHVLDLHHEAQTRFGHERFALSALAVFLSDIERLPRPFAIHHHGIGPLNAILPQVEFMTILRPPVERLVSYFHHVVRTQRMGVNTNEITAEGLDIVEFYKRSPWHLTGYCAWFGSLMWQAAGLYPRELLLDVIEPCPELLTTIRQMGESFAHTLADYVVRSFAYVGFFDQISQSLAGMATHLGHVSALPCVPHLNRGTAIPSSASNDELESLCHLDVAFYNSVRQAFDARSALATA